MFFFSFQDSSDEDLENQEEATATKQQLKRKAAERLNPRKKIKPEDTLLQEATAALKTLSAPPQVPVEPNIGGRSNDDLDIFGQMIASELRLIPDPRQRQLLKGKLQAVITSWYESSLATQLSPNAAMPLPLTSYMQQGSSSLVFYVHSLYQSPTTSRFHMRNVSPLPTSAAGSPHANQSPPNLHSFSIDSLTQKWNADSKRTVCACNYIQHDMCNIQSGQY